jgi:hypothetical protein
MTRKIIAFVTAATFVFFTFACYTIRKISPAIGKENEKVYRLVTKEGRKVEFEENKPGSIHDKAIEITVPVAETKEVELDIHEIKAFYKKNDGTISNIKTKDEKIHLVSHIIAQDETKIRFTTSIVALHTQTVSLTDVLALWVKRKNKGLTIAAILVPIGVAVLILVQIDHSMRHTDWSPPPRHSNGWD